VPCSQRVLQKELENCPAPIRLGEVVGFRDTPGLTLDLHRVSDHEVFVEARLAGDPTRGNLRRARLQLRWLLLRIESMTPTWLEQSCNPESYLHEAWSEYEAARFDSALKMYQRFFLSIEVQPESGNTFCLIYEHERSTKTGSSLYRKGIGVSEEVVDSARAQWAAVLLRSGDPETAVMIWQLQEGNSLAAFFLAEYQRQQGNLKTALRNYQRASELGHDLADLFVETLARDIGSPEPHSPILMQYEEANACNEALEILRGKFARSGDSFYISAQIVLLESVGRFTEIEELLRQKQSNAADPKESYLQILNGPDRASAIETVVSEANQGNFYALDALITDASRRDAVTEVDYWTKSKREVAEDPARGGETPSSPAQIDALVQRLGKTMGMSAVALIGAANLTRISLKETQGTLRNIEASLNAAGPQEESSSADPGGEDPDSEADFSGFEGF
jgi:tetratricopeptide (TPR) repeat protein